MGGREIQKRRGGQEEGKRRGRGGEGGEEQQRMKEVK